MNTAIHDPARPRIDVNFGSLQLRLVAAMIVFFMLWAAAAHAAVNDRKIALVFGNNNYQYIKTLANAENDATAMAERLSDLGFEVTKVVDVGLADARAALDEFGRAMEKSSVALLYYAGHGVQIQGESFLLPTDIDPKRVSDLRDDALTLTEIHAKFQRARPRVGLLILDACRNDPFSEAAKSGLRNRGIDDGSKLEISQGLAPIAGIPGMLIAYAAAPGAVAKDGVGGNSPFTAALIKWIDRPGLEIGRMFRHVRQNVIELTGGSQVPWVEEALVDEFYFLPALLSKIEPPTNLDARLWQTVQLIREPEERRAALRKFVRFFPNRQRSVLADGQLEVLNKSTAAEPGKAGDRDGSHWLSIRESTDASDYQAYLEQWPSGIFADMAKERLASLASLKVAANRATQSSGAAETKPLSTAEKEAALNLGPSRVASIQDLLIELGHFAGTRSGKLDKSLRQAIRLYQLELGGPETGFLDTDLLKRLVADAAPSLLRKDVPEDRRFAIHALAAIALKGPNAEPVVVRWTYTEGTPEIHDYWRSIVHEFEANHPTVDIRMKFTENVEFKTSLLANLASAKPPHILMTWGGGHIKALVDSKFVRDLTIPMSDAWALAFKPGALRNFTINDRVYAVPMRFTLSTIWYNKILLQKAGIDAAAIRSWDDLIGAVQKLKQAGIIPFSIGGFERWPLQLFWGSLALRTGGESKFRSAISGELPGFRDPAFVRAGELLTRLTKLRPFAPDYRSLTASQAQRRFALGEAAMTLDGDWMLTGVEAQWPGGPEKAALELGRLNFPSTGGNGSETRVETYGGVSGWAVSTGAPPEAVDFLRFFVSPKHQRIMAAKSFLVPVIAGADSSLTNPIRRDMAQRLSDSDYHQLYYDQALGIEAGEVVNTVVTLLASGSIEPEDVANAVQRAWQRHLAGTPIGGK